jgi:fermentation-respiration switch protein FrsA (DUF1100 family)
MEPLLVTEPFTLAQVPLLHVYPKGLVGPAPTILWHHGWASAKENHRRPAEILAASGMRVLMPDAYLHGERTPPANFDGTAVKRRFWEVVLRTIQESDSIITEAIAAGWTDPSRIGSGGHSMGAMIAAGAIARYKWTKVAVLCNGCPCYIWGDQTERWVHGLPDATPEEQRLLAAYDPEHRLNQIAPRPLLLLHGQADTTVPVAASRRFVEAARPFYLEQPDHLELKEFPGVGHHVTDEMLQALGDWFTRHLGNGK